VVEYATLVAGHALGSVTAAASAFMADLDWEKVSYVALALVAVRIASWAFRIRI
jgi:hypothetical protein